MAALDPTPDHRPDVITALLRDVVRDSGFQVRAKLDAATVERYARLYRAGAPLPPVQIARVGSALILVDGWHRVAAQEVNHATRVEAVITDATEEEARWFAADANTKHGLPLKASEIRTVFKAYVRAKRYQRRAGDGYSPVKSYRDIARELGGYVTHTTVRNWMRSDYPSIAAKMAKGDPESFESGAPTRHVRSDLAESARRHLEEAGAAGRGVQDAGERAELVKLSRTVAAQIKAARPAPVFPAEQGDAQF
jgi:hypothetical protein